MERARRAGLAALIVVVMIAGGGPRSQPALAADVGWPVSTLVLSEFQTGGASASDEFVEIANQGPASVDLAGLELIYVTASGSTVTRKAGWDAALILEPGRRLLLANAAGAYAPLADLAYSGGFAATGGALAVRVVGGAVVDAVGWGDATSGFVEGSPASAPPAGSSLERRPGGLAGNAIDSNDNATDWVVQPVPGPQGLASPPVPSPTPTPTPGQSPSPTPSPVPTPLPTPLPTPTPTPEPSPIPTPTPSPTPLTTPTPTPVVAPTPIASARDLPDGTIVTVQGVLTTRLGAVESGRGGFIQDDTGGIAVYLDAPVVGNWPAGTTVTASGAVSSRFSQRTLRVAETAVERGDVTSLPAPLPKATGEASESVEGMRVIVAGTVIGAPDSLTDGLGITLDDGSGPVRAVIGAEALAGQTVGSGMLASVTGPLGQRDSSGTGNAGYRIHATLAGELVLTDPIPTPTPTPTPAPTPAASPTPTPDISPTPGTTPSPTPVPSQSIAAARSMPMGTRVRVAGVITAELGRLGTPALIAIGDDSGGIAVRLPAGAAGFPRGTLVTVGGTLAAPYGQLEIRPTDDGVQADGSGQLPVVIGAPPDGLDEADEARLETASGTVSAKPKRSSGGDLTIVLDRPGAASIKLLADASSQLAADVFEVGATYRVVGVVGQRASKKGALDGYRICLRDAADIVATLGTVGSDDQGGPAGSPGSSQLGGPSFGSVISVSAALVRLDQTVAIEAVVTAPSALLDSTGRRIVVQDASAAIEVLLPIDTEAPRVGTRIRAQGQVGLAYGAPRLRVDVLAVLGPAPSVVPLTLRRPPGLADEWRLVTITGRINDVRKLGERWRAEILVGSARVVVVGQPGSGIAVDDLAEGRMARVTGIVRRPYPTATDQSYAITPRTRSDLDILGAAVVAGRSTSGSEGNGNPGTAPDAAGASPAGTEARDADLADLATMIGRTVRVGGLVLDLRSDGVVLDDGTAVGVIVLRGTAAALLPLLEPDDAINAIGRVELQADGPVVVVDDPGAIVQAGDPTAAATVAEAATTPPPRAGEAPAGPLASATSAGQRAGLLDGPIGVGAGLGTLIAFSLLSLAITVARRAQAPPRGHDRGPRRRIRGVNRAAERPTLGRA